MLTLKPAPQRAGFNVSNTIITLLGLLVRQLELHQEQVLQGHLLVRLQVALLELLALVALLLDLLGCCLGP